jgi:hypothetical protein
LLISEKKNLTWKGDPFFMARIPHPLRSFDLSYLLLRPLRLPHPLHPLPSYLAFIYLYKDDINKPGSSVGDNNLSINYQVESKAYSAHVSMLTMPCLPLCTLHISSLPANPTCLLSLLLLTAAGASFLSLACLVACVSCQLSVLLSCAFCISCRCPVSCLFKVHAVYPACLRVLSVCVLRAYVCLSVCLACPYSADLFVLTTDISCLLVHPTCQ